MEIPDERQGWEDGKIEAAAREHLDPLTGRLRPEECGMLYQCIGASYDLGWAAVALRIPAALRPTKEDWAEYRKRRGPIRAMCPGGCDDPACQDCKRLEEELGRFTWAEILDAKNMANQIGGMSFGQLDREVRRRLARGLAG